MSEQLERKIGEVKDVVVGVSRAMRSLGQDIRARDAELEIEMAKKRSPW